MPWRWSVAAAVAVPVVALLVATWREIRLYRRFGKYREDRRRSRSRRGSLESVERGGRIQTFVDGVPRQAAEVAVLVGALAVSVVGLGIAIHLTTQLERPDADRLRRVGAARQPVRRPRRGRPQQPGVLADARRTHRPVGAGVGRRDRAGGDVLPVRPPAALGRPAAVDPGRLPPRSDRADAFGTSRPSTARRSRPRSATSTRTPGCASVEDAVRRSSWRRSCSSSAGSSSSRRPRSPAAHGSPRPTVAQRSGSGPGTARSPYRRSSDQSSRSSVMPFSAPTSSRCSMSSVATNVATCTRRRTTRSSCGSSPRTRWRSW